MEVAVRSATGYTELGWLRGTVVRNLQGVLVGRNVWLPSCLVVSLDHVFCSLLLRTTTGFAVHVFKSRCTRRGIDVLK